MRKFYSVVFGVVVNAFGHKQDSLTRGGLRDKLASTLHGINYSM